MSVDEFKSSENIETQKSSINIENFTIDEATYLMDKKQYEHIKAISESYQVLDDEKRPRTSAGIMDAENNDIFTPERCRELMEFQIQMLDDHIEGHLTEIGLSSKDLRSAFFSQFDACEELFGRLNEKEVAEYKAQLLKLKQKLFAYLVREALEKLAYELFSYKSEKYCYKQLENALSQGNQYGSDFNKILGLSSFEIKSALSNNKPIKFKDRMGNIAEVTLDKENASDESETDNEMQAYDLDAEKMKKATGGSSR